MTRTTDTKERLLSAALDLIWSGSYGTVGVEEICARADVRKGTFYHFFPSKADLVVAAYEAHWQEVMPSYEAIFSAAVPPLERLTRWCGLICEKQTELFKRYGHVCGCPFSNVGGELSTRDEKLRRKSAEMIECGLSYVERAIGDAVRAKIIPKRNVREAAEAVGACVLGQMLHAKILNEPEMLRDLDRLVMQQLGVTPLPKRPVSSPSKSKPVRSPRKLRTVVA
jgi:TetR/AcrR family transcriptional regulator, transcriptional repressor for nem operon